MSATALLFPGQGSQEPGMGRELAESNRDAMDLWKKAERISGIALREIYWDGAEEDMALTRNLQPALTVVNINLWRAVSGKLAPGATAGHSLGEYSALAAAEVLPTETILELVALRGRLMDTAGGGGTMAAVVKLSLEQVEACVASAKEATGSHILVANYNTPGQFVVSGSKEAVAHVQENVKAAKGRAIMLAVSGAFHSPLMAEASAEFSAAISAIPKSAWNKARFPLYCNAEPVAASAPEAIKELMQRQMTSPVRWIETIQRQWDDGCRLFVECGPKAVVSKMVGPILQQHPPATAPDGEKNLWETAGITGLEQAGAFSVA